MSKRNISAIVFAIIVAIELIMFVTDTAPTKTVSTGQKGFFASSTTVIDHESRQDRNQKFITVIGATVLIGGILTFALPNKKKEGD